MKKVLRVVLILAVIVFLVLAGLFFYIDQIAKTAIEEGTEYAMGTKSTVAVADVQPLGGRFEMADLQIRNPTSPKFETSDFLKLGSSSVEVSLGSLMEDTVELPSLKMDKLDLTVEGGKDQTNIDVIMGNLEKLSKKDGDDKPKETEEGKKFVIKEVKITNIRLLLVNVKGLGKPDKPHVIEIDEIVLEDVGSDTDGGVVMKELAGTVVAAVFKSILKNPGAIPAVALDTLGGAVAKVGELGEVPAKIVGDITNVGVEALGNVAGEAGKAVENITGEAGKAVENITGEAGKAVEGIGGGLKEGVGGLLGGKKDDESKNDGEEKADDEEKEESGNPVKDAAEGLGNLLGGGD